MAAGIYEVRAEGLVPSLGRKQKGRYPPHISAVLVTEILRRFALLHPSEPDTHHHEHRQHQQRRPPHLEANMMTIKAPYWGCRTYS
jgi:hypothetical protein